MSGQASVDASAERILSLTRETQFSPKGIVSRVVLSTPTTRVVLFGFAAGQELSKHTSTSEALIQVLSGECEVTLDGTAHSLKAGDFLHVPPGHFHAVKATKQFSMLLTLLKKTAPPAPTFGKSSAKLEKPTRNVSLKVP
jgi:quercetin dioxygenase-like cupin family protein